MELEDTRITGYPPDQNVRIRRLWLERKGTEAHGGHP